MNVTVKLEVAPTVVLETEADMPKYIGETVPMATFPDAERYPDEYIDKLILPLALVEVGLTILKVTQLLLNE